MAFQTILPRALAARGLTVETVPGWETRGSSAFNPGGAVCHWTAGPSGTFKRPSLGIVTTGRPDLPGPLCNVYLDRYGVAVVVAAGRANHAGTGSWKGLVGNSAVFGTEAESAGPNDWTTAQRIAYPRINAAFCDIGKFGAAMICGHSEWAGPRKTDINGYTTTAMRAAVAAILAGDPNASIPEEDDMFSETRDRATIENTAYLVGQIKEQTDRLYEEDVQTDQLVWGLLDPDNGLRVQVASLQGQLAGLTAAVQQLGTGGGSLDMAAVVAAADRAATQAAADALGGLADRLRPPA